MLLKTDQVSCSIFDSQIAIIGKSKIRIEPDDNC